MAVAEPQLLALSHSLPELIPYLLVVEAVQDHPTSQVQEVVRPEQMEAAQAEMPAAAVLLVEAEVVEAERPPQHRHRSRRQPQYRR